MNKIMLVFTAVIALACTTACGLNGEDYKKRQTFEGNNIDEIELNNDSWDAIFRSSESTAITIEVDGKNKDKNSIPVTIEQVGKKIMIHQEKQQSGVMDGISLGKEGIITISIPKNEVSSIIANHHYGDLTMKDIQAHSITVFGESGVGDIEGVFADKAQFTSKDGELSVKNSSLKELTMSSHSGDNYLTHVTSDKMTITSRDGEVVVKEAAEGELLCIETGSGDVAVSYKTAPTSLMLTAASDSSDITIDLARFKETKQIENAKEGRIGAAENTMRIISKTGIIQVK